MKMFDKNFIEKKKNIFIDKNLEKDRPLSEIKIWRYMDLCKFFSLWRGSLYLPNRNKTGDKREMGIRVYQKGDKQHVNPFLTFQIVGENENIPETTTKPNAFVSCWSVSDHENYLLWKSYLDGPCGIAIQTTLQSLIDSIQEAPEEPVYISKVQYEEMLLLSNDHRHTLFTKHVSYKEEKELRLGILLSNAAAKTLKIDPNVLIESVVISPLLETSMQKELYHFFKTFLFKDEVVKYSEVVEKQ